MSHDHDMTVSQMQWKPRLVALTQIAHPDIAGGVGTRCFLNPASIAYIYRFFIEQKRKETKESLWTEGTVIVMEIGGHITVEESPETVAAMRDRSLGYAPEMMVVHPEAGNA